MAKRARIWDGSQYVDIVGAAGIDGTNGTDGVVVSPTQPASPVVGQIWIDSDEDITAPPGDIPVGGTTGQVLSKNSNTDYDLEWADATVPPPDVWPDVFMMMGA